MSLSDLIKFPAFSEKYKEGVLFPERFDIEWYKSPALVGGMPISDGKNMSDAIQLDAFGSQAKTDEMCANVEKEEK